MCGVVLTTKNWYACLRGSRVYRCNICNRNMTRQWRKLNHERWQEGRRTYFWKLKLRALHLLGGPKCVRCGTTDIRILQINHIKGGGTKDHRAAFGTLYRLILQGKRLVDDLDVKCANCNLIYEYERGVRELPKLINNPLQPPLF